MFIQYVHDSNNAASNIIFSKNQNERKYDQIVLKIIIREFISPLIYKYVSKHHVIDNIFIDNVTLEAIKIINESRHHIYQECKTTIPYQFFEDLFEAHFEYD